MLHPPTWSTVKGLPPNYSFFFLSQVAKMNLANRNLSSLLQDEEALLCRVATQHDLADSFQLRSTGGWQTLQVILNSTGERIPKRLREYDEVPSTTSSSVSSPPLSSSSSFHSKAPSAVGEPGEPLAKRFAAFRLNERRAASPSNSSPAPPPPP